MNLVLLAAGKGTRFYPLTKTLPKALVPILNRPMIDYVLDPFIHHITKIICVINSETGPALQEYLGTTYRTIPVSYVTQSNPDQKGTWPSLAHALPYIDPSHDAFCVANCDDLLDHQSIDEIFKASSRSPGIGISFATMPNYYLSINHHNNRVVGITRNKDRSEPMISDWFANGFHILNRSMFSLKPVAILGGEFGLPQTLFANLDTYPLVSYPITGWQAVNGPDDVPAAEAFIASRAYHLE